MDERRDLVVVVDDEPLVLRAVERILAPSGQPVETVSGLSGLERWIADPRLAVVLLDLFIDGSAGSGRRTLEAMHGLRRERPNVAVVVMTGRASIESAVQCMRAGAFDYLCKPFPSIERVREAVQAACWHVAGDGASEAAPAGDGDDSVVDWLRVPLVEPQVHGADVPLSLEAYERLALERALRESAGDASGAARRLGIGRSTFYRRAAKVGVELRRGEGDGLLRRSPSDDGAAPRVGGGPAIG